MHRIELPRIVLVGQGVIDLIGEVCEELEIKRALMVSGERTYNVAGEKVHTILGGKGVPTDLIYARNADMETVERVKGWVMENDADAVLGVGGGRTIDVAKLGAARGRTLFISVPTAASHDGIASSLASIKGLDRPYSITADVPIAVVADSRIVAESPFRFTASGCGDVISKSVAVRDWRLAHRATGEYYGEYAGSLALMSASMIIECATQIRDRLESGYRTLLEALVSCGVAMSIAGSSRPCSGSEHLFSHALDVIAPGAALHGEQCGVGTIMMAKLHGLDWASIRDSLRTIGAPTNARELGVGEGAVVEALVKAREIRPDRYTILDEVKLTHATAGDLARGCGVI